MARGYAIRPARSADEPFLREMGLLAAFPPGTLMPPPDAIEADERLARYLDGWGRPGDAGVVAEAEGVPIGAAWYRRFSKEAPGYGFVSDEIPELSIAVTPVWRGRGVGGALLRALVDRAPRDGLRALSLSVSRSNSVAMRLYAALGFRVVGGTDSHPTMLLELFSDRWSDPRVRPTSRRLV